MTGHRAAPRRSSANRSSRRPTPGARCAAAWPRRSSPARMPAPHTAIPCARPRSRESRVVPCRIPNSSRRRRCILRRAGCTDAHRRCGECRRPRTRPSSDLGLSLLVQFLSRNLAAAPMAMCGAAAFLLILGLLSADEFLEGFVRDEIDASRLARVEVSAANEVSHAFGILEPQQSRRLHDRD